ncbi:hypothetical protein PV327_000684, partial [Microctonus hyperodae]
RAVVNSILDTLSNNDFVTILQFNNETDEVVPCFKDKLIQATPENLLTFRTMMNDLDPVEVANLTNAFVRAFDLLRTYRESRNCGPATPCNQLIMLVTDGVASDISEVFENWNRQENGTQIPVRIFTYLLGREVTKVREIQTMACTNRGYYTHVHTQEESQEQVLKYIPVVARPLVLQGNDHPIIWTHAYADVSRAKGENVRLDPATLSTTSWQEYRLLTSVSIPAFDRKSNRNNETRLANLLGVAGTDVPIEDIQKLTLPYKLGVNGYAFIVSNNGYVILHPDLRPVSEGQLKLNYNSIDLTEVEILDDGRGPRDPGSQILELRQALVDHKHGSLKNVPVKFHYDDNRRVKLEKRDYYYAPLPGTPFGIAVAIPNYGKTWIKVTNEIEKIRQAGINVSDYFIGNRWRVHPGWVYCRHHYLEGHEYIDAETELRFFLGELSQPDWKWSDQYTAYNISLEEEEEPDCGRQVLKNDDYYCNEELMQLLVFDAKATNESYSNEFKFKDEHSEYVATRYGVFVRFVATQSGLTRWQIVDPNYEVDEDMHIEFGDLHRRAVNEPWYKGAIFQHQIDPNSISLTVPWNAGPDAIVTASMAIYPRDGGKNASAAVVGFQLPMAALYQRFIEITSITSNPDMDCSHPWIDCYLIDQNGFVVLSEAHNDTGQFMGAVEGAVMKSMIDQGYFNAVEIYDYQASCKNIGLEGTGSLLNNPLRYIWNIFLWLFARAFWMTSQFINLPEIFARIHSDEDLPDKPKPPDEIEIQFACDQKRKLYIMNQTMAVHQITNSSIQCSRPFYAQLVPYTNLLLVVVNTLYPSCYERLEVLPEEIDPSEYPEGTEPAPCHKKSLGDLPRRPLEECFTEHSEEEQILQCGRGTRLHLTPISGRTDIVSHATVKRWAHKLGFELSQLGKYVTNVQKFEESYKQADVKPRDGKAFVHEIAKDIKAMMESKISAIKRIMDIAETSALSSKEVTSPEDVEYINAKNNTVDLQFSKHFGGEVNLNMSAVHVPTNVYDRAPDVIKAIKWSEELDQTFINNFEHDPSLSWQYFGSATGFMRQYPATMWNPKPVDLFDCRTRGWYIEAATSPKDIIILVDTSGSMMGMRKEIARHVVNNILDTLGNNDFVNIITFSNETHEVVPCFNDTLVQANLANVRELKDAIADMRTERIANFSLVLGQAFRLLERFRVNREGASCNQAIMLITDGVPYNYKEIFQEWNWNNTDEPEKSDMPVRVFTYLIGREVTDVREVKWMACANRGYYVHLSTFAEVRERVLNYVPVMARPLVLGKTDHPTIWTPVYADITDPKMTDWLWEQRECEEQKERFLAYRRDKRFFNSKGQKDRRFVHKPKKHHEHDDDLQEYQLMTSVSMPVYDRRETANITEQVLIKEAYWVSQTRETRIADLLGVAGTDVPIQEIQKLMLPHMLGVNGYAFIVTNNGYILIHPDLRPVFQGILKPSYNAVDMAEVELLDLGKGPREFEEGILTFRDEVIDQVNGSVNLLTKYHYDDMKRVGRVKRKYDYTGIDNTPFTVVVSLPEHGHGSYRVHATEEIHRSHVNATPNTSDRDSYYCDRLLLQSLVHDAKVTEWFANINTTREEKGKEFQQRFGFTLAFMATHSGLTRWQDFPLDENQETTPSEDHFSQLYPRAIDEIWYKRAVEQYYVLPDSFVFSVPLDEEGADNTTLVTASRAIFIGKGKAKAPAAVVGFQFQHTALQGLFQNITYNSEKENHRDCSVESLACYLVDNNGYIIVAESESDTGKFFGEVRGPIMNSLVYDGIYDKIRIFDYQAVCFKSSQTSNDGNILLTPWKHIKRAFSWIIAELMLNWAKYGLWQIDYVHASDYVNEGEEVHDDYIDNDDKSSDEKGEKAFDQRVLINRTKPQPCDQEVYLYLMQNKSNAYDIDFDSVNGCERPYVVQPVEESNMLLIVVDTNCPNTAYPPVSVEPEEVIYTNASLACQKALSNLKRRKPQSCIRTSPRESEIKDRCGKASITGPNFNLLLLLIIFVFTKKILHD